MISYDQWVSEVGETCWNSGPLLRLEVEPFNEKFVGESRVQFDDSYTVLKVDGATPQRWHSKGHDKAIHGSCAIYFPGGILDTNTKEKEID